MESTRKTLKKILAALGALLGILFILFTCNQFIGLYRWLSAISSRLAFGACLVLLFLLSYYLLRLTYFWFRAPKVAELAEEAGEAECEKYFDQMLLAFERNPHLDMASYQNQNLPKRTVVEKCLIELDDQSAAVIQKNASQIFLTTAISQNGALDAIVVFVSLARMIWALAGIYNTRPSLRSMGKLYLQVAGVVFMARSLEDSSLLEEQMEPLIASVLGESIVSTVPGMVPVSNLIVSSILEGSINALLTLRVGFVCQNYLGNKELSRSYVSRRSAAKSIRCIGSIIKENSKRVVTSAVRAARQAGRRRARRLFGRDTSL